MANISSAANAFTLGAAGSTSGTTGTQGTPAANDSSGSFMRLVSGMIQGNTTADQLPSNLVDFLLTGDSSALEGLDLEADDKSDTDVDDEDAEAAGELALAAILAGVQAVKPVQTSHSAQSGGIGEIDVSSGQAAMQALANTAQEALTAAMGDAGSDAASAEGATDLSAQNPPTQGANSAAPLHHLLTAHKAAEAAPQAASAEVRTPVGTPGWADEIGTHLTLMAANGREAASLRLSPEHLGPVEVRISMKDGDASVVFTAANADTRSALEQSLPRLREMFASQGLVLGDANVSREGPRDSFRPATFANASRGSSDAGASDDVKRVTLSRVGLVDTYA
jgi:flagellar hook-length control protein FliK